MTTKRLISVMGLALLLSCSVPLLTAEQGKIMSLPTSSSNHDTAWLRQAPWTEDERAQYYHLTSGTQLIPYSWFMALEQAGSQDWFKADAHMQRLHLIPDEAHPLHNPDQLPLVLARLCFPTTLAGSRNISGSPALFAIPENFMRPPKTVAA